MMTDPMSEMWAAIYEAEVLEAAHAAIAGKLLFEGATREWEAPLPCDTPVIVEGRHGSQES